MLDIEIVGHITDTLALTSLSNRATLDKIKTRLNGATHQQFALAAITVLALASTATQSTFPSTLLFRPVEAHGRESSKSSWPKTRAAPDQSN